MFNQKDEIHEDIKWLERSIDELRQEGCDRDKHWGNYSLDECALFWYEWQLRHLRQIYNAWLIIEKNNYGKFYRETIRIDLGYIGAWADQEYCMESILPAAAAAILIC